MAKGHCIVAACDGTGNEPFNFGSLASRSRRQFPSLCGWPGMRATSPGQTNVRVELQGRFVNRPIASSIVVPGESLKQAKPLR